MISKVDVLDTYYTSYPATAEGILQQQKGNVLKASIIHKKDSHKRTPKDAIMSLDNIQGSPLPHENVQETMSHPYPMTQKYSSDGFSN